MSEESASFLKEVPYEDTKGNLAYFQSEEKVKVKKLLKECSSEKQMLENQGQKDLSRTLSLESMWQTKSA